MKVEIGEALGFGFDPEVMGLCLESIIEAMHRFAFVEMGIGNGVLEAESCRKGTRLSDEM